MLAFRAVILREDFAASGGLLLAFLLPWRHMWYLYALIFWHLTLPLLTRLRDKGLPFALLGLAGAVALGLWAGNVDWPFTLVRVFAYYPFYAFGVLFRPQIDRLDDLAATSPVMRLAPAGALVVCYGLYFRSLMLQEGQLRESAKIFNDVAYGEGYAMPDRAWFYAIGIMTSLALIAALGGCKAFAGLGKKTLAVYLFHMPIFAFYSELGFFRLAHEKPLPVTVVFVLLEALGCVCLLASAPVSKTLMLWQMSGIGCVKSDFVLWGAGRLALFSFAQHLLTTLLLCITMYSNNTMVIQGSGRRASFVRPSTVTQGYAGRLHFKDH